MATPETTKLTDSAAINGRKRISNLPAGQDPEKRAQILKGAAEIFSTMGFDVATIKDIARVAGVSKGTIYVYFHSKEALFLELSVAYSEQLFEEVRSVLMDVHEPREALSLFGEALFLTLTSNIVTQAQRIFIGVAQRMPSLSGAFYEKASRQGICLLRTYLDQQVSEGNLFIEDTELAAYQFTDLVGSGLFKPRLYEVINERQSRENMSKTVKAAVDFFLTAYRCATPTLVKLNQTRV